MDLPLHVLLAIVIFIVAWIRKRKQRFSIFKEHGIPGPEPNLWIGNLRDLVEKRDNFVTECVEKYGEVFGCFLGAKPVLVVTDPELIKTIQVKEFMKFSNRDVVLPDAGIPQPEFMASMPVLHDEEWKNKRKLMTPSFSTGKIKKIMPILNNTVDLFLEHIATKSGAKECANIIRLYENLSTDAITKTVCGTDTRVQLGENSKFVESAKLFVTADSAAVLPALSLCFPELEPLPTKLRNLVDNLRNICGLPAVKHVGTSVLEVIDRRRKYSERREDILQSMMDEKIDRNKLSLDTNDEFAAAEENKNDGQTANGLLHKDVLSSNHVSFSDDSLQGNAVALLIAGYSTTSGALSFATYYVAKNAEIQEKLREEINIQLKGKENIDYEDLSKLQYLDQIISETLRLQSPNMMTVSRVSKSCFKYNGMTIPKGITISIPSYHLHRNPDYWTNPEKFIPERFSPENKVEIGPHMYQPFGHGPRKCIGLAFAKAMMKLTLARMFKSYRIESCDNEELKVHNSLFVNRPKEFLVKIEPV